MYRCILLTGFLFSCAVVSAQQTSLQYSRKKADTIFRLIKEQSMYRSNVGWDTITTQFYQRIDTASTSANQFKAFRWLLRQMNDFHSQVFFENQLYAYYKAMPDGREDELTKTYKQLQPGFGVMQANILQNQYGYICIPGFSGNDAASINNTIKQWRDTICKNINKPVKGWIIDLRANMGGSMYPMMAALSFLIGDIKFTGSTNTNHQVEHWWSIKNGDVFFDNYPGTASGFHCMKEQIKAPVVLLTSFYTVSSGEIVVTAFKQRPRTLQIGDTTGGLVTNNHWMPIGNDAVLNLSKGYYADRKGKEYRAGIPADMVIKADEDFDDLLNDKKVQAAIKWLKKKK
jgi:carboxyl-terminal processing protease